LIVLLQQKLYNAVCGRGWVLAIDRGRRRSGDIEILGIAAQ
jgi:hypothetical protein